MDGDTTSTLKNRHLVEIVLTRQQLQTEKLYIFYLDVDKSKFFDPNYAVLEGETGVRHRSTVHYWPYTTRTLIQHERRVITGPVGFGQ